MKISTEKTNKTLLPYSPERVLKYIPVNMEDLYEQNKKQISSFGGHIITLFTTLDFYFGIPCFILYFFRNIIVHDSKTSQYNGFYFAYGCWAFFFHPLTLAISENQERKKKSPAGCSADKSCHFAPTSDYEQLSFLEEGCYFRIDQKRHHAVCAHLSEQ